VFLTEEGASAGSRVSSVDTARSLVAERRGAWIVGAVDGGANNRGPSPRRAASGSPPTLLVGCDGLGVVCGLFSYKS
jgi:hypothetical protein